MTTSGPPQRDSALARLVEVMATLSAPGESEAFVLRLAGLVREVANCRLEGFRAASGEWITAPDSVGAETLRAAVDGAVPDGPTVAPVTLPLPGRGWAGAFPVSRAGDGQALLVVSAPDSPPVGGVEQLRSLALGIRLAEVAWRSALTREAARSTRAESAALRTMLDAQRRLAGAVTDGGGLIGLASTLSDIVGRPVRIWDWCGRCLAGHRGEAADGPSDPAGLTSVTGAGGSPWWQDEWWCVAMSSDGRMMGVVGMHDPEGAAGAGDRLALEQAGTVAALEQFRLESVARVEMRVWGDLAAEILFGDDRDRARSHAVALGYDLDRPHRVALVRAAVPGAGLLDAVVRTLRSREIEAMATAAGTDVAVLVPGDADWDGFVHALTARVGSVRVGVGGRGPTGEQLAGHLREADLALRIGSAVGTSAVVRFDDLGVYRLLAVEGNPEELHQYVEDSFGPVLVYDRDHGTNFFRTVATYLESGCSLDRAARELFIHRSTLKYRLRRAGELLGKDLTDPDVRFHLELAARAVTTFEALSPGSGPARFIA